MTAEDPREWLVIFLGSWTKNAPSILRARLREHNEECPKSFNCVSYPGYVVYSIYGEIKDILVTKNKHTILVNVGTENIHKYISFQYLFFTTNSIEITGVANAEEFVAAVKEQM